MIFNYFDNAKKGGFQLDFHGITGLLAIILMLFHALWATIVLVRNDEKAKGSFHKLSIIVWVIWLIPFSFRGDFWYDVLTNILPLHKPLPIIQEQIYILTHNPNN